MHIVKIDLEKCIGCKECYWACFVDVIRWDEAQDRPVVAYPEECATCNWCELSCCNEAVEVIPINPVPYPEPYPKSAYPASYATS
jgi:NAD-dependent dihydropyrimidine dehydrogenase PreA subunit